ncbi:DUF397 domain-containing protein [Nocardia tengchongensis]|uniref:DUF397 domain-containing protein n=1 Tax=Nocardia tengchongensis TaxID=2055889 RepID=UPI0036970775
MTPDLTGAHWFKSSRSHASGECVEAAHLPGGQVAVRDSKQAPDGPILLFPGPAWDTFTTALRAGTFDQS